MAKKKSKPATVDLEAEEPTGAAAEFLPIDAIHPWPANPHPPAAAIVREIAASIDRFGFGAPIVARRENGEIIKGHARYLAAQKLALRTVPVRLLDLSEDESHALAMADNKIATNRKRDWGDDDVAAIMAELEAKGTDVQTGTGFSAKEIDKLLEEIEKEQAAPAPSAGEASPLVGAGITWDLRNVEALTMLRDLPADSVDAVITDPRYSTDTKYVGDRGIDRLSFQGDNRDQRSFVTWCAIWLQECLRVARTGAAIAVFCDWRQCPAMTDAIQAGGWIWRGIVPWDKGEGTRPQKGRFRAQAEYVVWGSKGEMPVSRLDGASFTVLPGVIRESVRQDDKHHQTGKPTMVMRWLARVCVPGGLILDPFAGSGSTGVGALLEGRSFLGSEQSPEYAEVARRRLAAAAAGETYGSGGVTASRGSARR